MMGAITADKRKGRNCKKINLVLVFTILFCISTFQGWYGQKEAWAYPSSASGSYTVSEVGNRVSTPLLETAPLLQPLASPLTSSWSVVAVVVGENIPRPVITAVAAAPGDSTRRTTSPSRVELNIP